MRKFYNWYLSTFIFHYFHFLMKKYLKRYQHKISGEILDVGCGNKPYKTVFKNVAVYKGTNANSYYENSLFKPSEDDYIVEDGTSLPFSSEEFDNVLNFQVLPVFDNPNDFFREVKRVLKPNGYFLLTTDFLYPIWNAPNNYWRTTKYGLEKLAKKNDYEIISLEAFGGYWVMQARILERYLRSMLPQLIARASFEKNILLKLMKYLRILFWLIIVIIAPLFVNLSFIVLHHLDKILLDEEFTTNYIVLMQKK